MNDFSLSFILGFICTAALFAFCFLSVVGAKSVITAVKKFFPTKSPPAPETKRPKKPRVVKSPQTIRSIEIDPSQVDRIYVKKSS